MSKKHRKTNIYLLIGAIMEELLKLLNEYEKEKKSGFTWRSIDSYDNCVYGVDCDGETEITMYSDLYSKQYGFIKWLVDNDKIDTVLFANELNKVVYLADFNFRNDEGFYKTIYKQLLMLLSIQDNSIEFLISILK